MRFKKLLLMMVLLAIAGTTYADDNLSVEDLSVKPGETTTVDICLTNSTKFTAFQLDLVLPEGITIAKNKKGKDDVTVDEDRKEDHSVSLSETTPGTYTMVCASLTNSTFYETSRAILHVGLKADDNAEGEKTVSIKNILFTDESRTGHNLADVSFKVTVVGLPKVTADNKTRAYGDANPELTYTVSGGDITATPTLTTEAIATSPVGDYPITVSADDSYTAVNGTLTVTKAPLTISGGTYTIKQGEELPTFAAEYTGFKNDETSAVLTTQPTLTLAEGVTGASEPGNYDITVAGATADNYEISFTNGTLTITEADPVTVTATNLTMAYGDEVPTLAFTSEGATLSGTPAISCEATSTSPVGTYPIVIAKGTVTNYNATYVDGTLTIKPRIAALTWSDGEFTYNGTEQKPTASVSNLVGEDACTVTVSGATNAGEHTATATALSNTNYKLSDEADAKTHAFTIAPLTATLNWSNTELTYNGQEQSPTATVSNLIGGDECTVTVSGATNAGEQTVTATALSNANYTLPEEDAAKTHAFTIAPLMATLAWSNTSFTYNGQEQKPTATVSNLVGDDECTVTVSGATNAGEHTSIASAISNTNYTLPETPAQAFTIAQVPLTISGGEYSMKKGESLPAFQAEYSGFVNNETRAVLTTQPTLTTEATSESSRGEYAIVVSGAEATNYDINYVDGRLTIFEIIANEGGTTIEEAEDGHYVVNIDEESGTTSESGVIADEQLDVNGTIAVAELTYNRELDAPSAGNSDVTIDGTEARLYTICLPDVPATAANAKYYTLDAANATTLSFVEVDNSSLEANTPYLVAVTSGSDLIESQDVTGVTLKREADNSIEKDGFVFKGTLTGMKNADAAAAGAYILQTGNLWGKVTTNHTSAYIPPFRAYIVAVGSSAPTMLNGNIGEGSMTGIHTIRTIDQNGCERWYDLSGKRIEKLVKGVNVVNGRKVVIK